MTPIFVVSPVTALPVEPVAAVPIVSTSGSVLLTLVLVFVGLALGIVVILNVIRHFMRRRFQTGAAFRRVVILVTVPKETQEKGESGMKEKELREIQEDIGVMESVFASIGGLPAEKGITSWFVGRQDAFSFEIVSQQGLVSFYIAVPESRKDFIEQQVHAHFPHAQIEEVEDYNVFVPNGAVVAARLLFRRMPAFPLKTFRKLEHDPLNALANALAKVDKADGAAIQVVVRSSRRRWRRRGARFTSAMQQGKTMNQALAETTWRGQVLKAFMLAKPKTVEQGGKEHKLSPLEEEMVKSMEEKISKFGLDANVRVVASAATAERASLYVNNIIGAFSQFNSPQYGNSLVRSNPSQKRLIHDFIYRHFRERGHLVLNGEELASMYHFPLPSTETPNIRWLTARKAAPPSNLPKEGLYLGEVEYRGITTPVFIKPGDRLRHMYCIGKSGAGKSEFIANLAAQDVKNGDGLCIIDPHGDLVETVLGCVPRERADDVVVFDPSDMDRPIGLNMLEAPSEEMKDFVCGEMIAIFYKLFPPEMIGPMFEHNMRNFMLTLMSDRDNPGTIAEVPRLIVDPEYQKQWVKKVRDPVVLNFWEKEIAKTSDFHKSEMFGYLISKVGRFVENAMMRNIIGQQKSAFDFRKIMDERKIFLVNLSKGKIGDINANLLGLIIVTKLQMAAMGRADMPASERKPFYLYIDEFQNFITPSVATILSEARKYALSLYLSHQYLGQLSPKGDNEIRDAVLGNAGTIMCGRIGVEDAQYLEKEFAPVFSAFDLVNAPKFSWNTKMLIDNQSSRPFNFSPPPPVQPERRIAEALKMLSRLKYGRDRVIVEQEILERTQLGPGGAAATAVGGK
ncbi:MAG: DUF87 domain-containing protein [Patescibacteria group bacterium]|nr:DUF87 domain-containing protein [Patescibacteria group bacterium]